MKIRRTPRTRIDAEVARELLNHSNPQAEAIEGDRDGKLFWKIQKRIVWGGLTQSREVVDEAQNARSDRLAELHTRIVQFPEDTTAHAERDRLLQEIAAEALQELLEEERREQSA